MAGDMTNSKSRYHCRMFCLPSSSLTHRHRLLIRLLLVVSLQLLLASMIPPDSYQDTGLVVTHSSCEPVLAAISVLTSYDPQL